MLNKHLIMALLAVIMVALGGAVVAQDSQNEEPQKTVAAIGANSKIKVCDIDTSTITGSLLKYTDDSLWMVNEAGQAGVAMQRIDRLWKRGRSTLRGATVGAVAGALALGYLGYQANEEKAPSEKFSNTALYFGFPLIGAIVGGLTGTGVGSLTPRWHLKYQRPTETLKPPDEKAVLRKGTITIGSGPRIVTDSELERLDWGYGWQLSYLFHIGRSIALGPEVHAFTARLTANPLRSSTHWLWGGVVRVAFGTEIRPYLIAGASSDEDDYFAYSVGGGASYDKWLPFHPSLEMRWFGARSEWLSDSFNIRFGVAVSY